MTCGTRPISLRMETCLSSEVHHNVGGYFFRRMHEWMKANYLLMWSSARREHWFYLPADGTRQCKSATPVAKTPAKIVKIILIDISITMIAITLRKIAIVPRCF